MDNLEDLFKLEENIESYYIDLARLEVDGKKDTIEYLEFFNMLKEQIEEEAKVIQPMSIRERAIILEKLKKKCSYNPVSPCIGDDVKAYKYRLINVLSYMSGDDLFNYSTTLYYDINQIILSFLNYIIPNEYYEKISAGLIYYRYNLLFMNPLTEYDFFNIMPTSTITFDSISYRTLEMSSSVLADKSILLLEGLDNINFLLTLEDNFREDPYCYEDAVIAFMEVLARLILCDEHLLEYLSGNFDMIVKSDDTPQDVKALGNEMFQILNEIRNQITYTR